jgi:uncharacterized protein (TIGR03435 family)
MRSLNLNMLDVGGKVGHAEIWNGWKDPIRIRYIYMNSRTLLTTAFHVKAFQIMGPSWLDSEWFDIQATMPPNTTARQLDGMLQNLVLERHALRRLNVNQAKVGAHAL